MTLHNMEALRTCTKKHAFRDTLLKISEPRKYFFALMALSSYVFKIVGKNRETERKEKKRRKEITLLSLRCLNLLGIFKVTSEMTQETRNQKNNGGFQP